MSEEAKQSADNSEVVRKLVIPIEPQTEFKEGDRSPTKTDRDLTTKVLPEANADPTSEDEAIRKLVVPEQSAESEGGGGGQGRS
jgi:hypothetical protein